MDAWAALGGFFDLPFTCLAYGFRIRIWETWWVGNLSSDAGTRPHITVWISSWKFRWELSDSISRRIRGKRFEGFRFYWEFPQSWNFSTAGVASSLLLFGVLINLIFARVEICVAKALPPALVFKRYASFGNAGRGKVSSSSLQGITYKSCVSRFVALTKK